ncbi:MAG TPA: hypothetical protein VH502_00325 [Actinoplanes sp.]
MTGWRVERTSRAAFRSPSIELTGDRSLMPSPSQGAERRTERRARRTGSRWGLRVLVIGGLAGAAWLLSGTAAQAADHDVAAAGPSLLGSVVAGDIAEPTVGTILQAAAQPLESDRPAQRHHDAASLLPAPVRALPVRSDAAPDRSTGATASVVRVVRGITGPLRLAGGPAKSPLAPLVRTLRPVTGLLPHVAGPVTDVLAHTAKPAVTAPPRPTARPAVHGTRTQHPIAAPAASRVIPAGTMVQTGPALRTTAAADLPGARYAATPDRTVAHPHSVSHTITEPDTVRQTPYGGDGPASPQGQFGAVNGLSTGGSGAPTVGGSAAVLPSAVAAGSMGFHRLAQPTDVEVRRSDAKAPTVSPD